jgi:hypothetical protein
VLCGPRSLSAWPSLGVLVLSVWCGCVWQLLARLRQFELPCVVAMDMNAPPPAKAVAATVAATGGDEFPHLAYPLITSEPFLPAGGDGGGSAAPLSSAYCAALGGNEPEWTSWKRRGSHEAKHTIDFIFVSSGIGVVRVLLPPQDEEVDVGTGLLPSWEYPSDHVALFAELLMPTAVADGGGDGGESATL